MRIIAGAKRLIRSISCTLALILALALSPSAALSQQQATGDSVLVNDSGKIPITQQDYSNDEIEMADAWRANGKIYVVVAVLASLLVGLVLFLVFLERKMSKLEQDLKE